MSARDTGRVIARLERADILEWSTAKRRRRSEEPPHSAHTHPTLSAQLRSTLSIAWVAHAFWITCQQHKCGGKTVQFSLAREILDSNINKLAQFSSQQQKSCGTFNASLHCNSDCISVDECKVNDVSVLVAQNALGNRNASHARHNTSTANDLNAQAIISFQGQETVRYS